CVFFFFSSRRRHTRFSRDWSSDVCSSDLVGGRLDLTLRPSGPGRDYDGTLTIRQFRVTGVPALAELLDAISVVGLLTQLNGPGRSEERRVGKECSSRAQPYHRIKT